MVERGKGSLYSQHYQSGDEGYWSMNWPIHTTERYTGWSLCAGNTVVNKRWSCPPNSCPGAPSGTQSSPWLLNPIPCSYSLQYLIWTTKSRPQLHTRLCFLLGALVYQTQNILSSYRLTIALSLNCQCLKTS